MRAGFAPPDTFATMASSEIVMLPVMRSSIGIKALSKTLVPPRICEGQDVIRNSRICSGSSQGGLLNKGVARDLLELKFRSSAERLDVSGQPLKSLILQRYTRRNLCAKQSKHQYHSTQTPIQRWHKWHGLWALTGWRNEGSLLLLLPVVRR